MYIIKNNSLSEWFSFLGLGTVPFKFVAKISSSIYKNFNTNLSNFFANKQLTSGLSCTSNAFTYDIGLSPKNNSYLYLYLGYPDGIGNGLKKNWEGNIEIFSNGQSTKSQTITLTKLMSSGWTKCTTMIKARNNVIIRFNCTGGSDYITLPNYAPGLLEVKFETN
jgi:hypothetical protein